MSDVFVLEEAEPLPKIDIIPDGTVIPARIMSAKVITTKMTDKDTGEPIKQVEFIAQLQGDNYSFVDKEGQTRQRRVYGQTSTKFNTHENCRLRSWVQEIMAIDSFPAKYKLDLADLVDRECRVRVKVDNWLDKNTGEPRQANKIGDIRRATTAVSAPPSAPVPDDEPF